MIHSQCESVQELPSTPAHTASAGRSALQSARPARRPRRAIRTKTLTATPVRGAPSASEVALLAAHTAPRTVAQVMNADVDAVKSADTFLRAC